MAARKCKLCNKEIDKKEYDSCVAYKGGYVHEACFQISLQAIKQTKDEKLEEAKKKSKKVTPTKPKAELEKPVTEEEYQEKKKFFDYIRSYYQTEDNKLPAKIYVLADKYISQYGFTYNSMLQTLVYLREIIEHDFTGDGIGLIPYYAEEANSYYKSLDQVEQANKDKDVSKMYKTKVVKIQPKQRKIKQLDIDDI